MNIENAKFKSQRGTYKRICTYFATLDIETSSSDDNTMAWSYQQAIAMFDSEKYTLVDYKSTRNIIDMVDILVKLNNEIGDNGYLYIFVHNLSFDLSFFRITLINAIRKDNPSANYSELLTGTADWLTFKIGALEFRCSYRLTLMSLYTFTKTMNVKHIKLLGANDYGKHFSDEELPVSFNKYLYNDVVGLGEAICKLMKIEGLTLRTLPYTSTGFIRNELKRSFNQDRQSMYEVKDSKPQYNEFLLWNKAFRGGLNRLNKERAMDDNHGCVVRHVDFVSHYPALLLTRKYPYGHGMYYKFDYNVFTKHSKKNDNWLKDITYNEDYLIVARVLLVNYKPDKYKFNLFEQEETIVEVCTPDLQCLYEYADVERIVPLDVYVYKAKRLPEQIINIIKKYFTSKSILKEKIKTAKRNSDASLLELEAEYARAKAKLNGIGGLLQQKPMTDTYNIDDNGNIGEHAEFDLSSKTEVSNMLDKHYGSTSREIVGEVGKGKCFSLIHGVFMTAYGRQKLLNACAKIGWNNNLYSDTDSDFYLYSKEAEKRIEELNEQYMKEAIENDAYVDIEVDGQTKRCYLGLLEDEGETITRFKAISAKRYCYLSKERGFKVVCSSVSKGTDLYEDEEHNAMYAFTREMELCGLKENRQLTEEDINNGFLNFEDGFTFRRCSSTSVIRPITERGYYDIDGHKQYVDNGVILRKTNITLTAIHERQNLVTTALTFKQTRSGVGRIEKEENIL